jgi:acetolactate synthase-1/2/3 large subunit
MIARPTISRTARHDGCVAEPASRGGRDQQVLMQRDTDSGRSIETMTDIARTPLGADLIAEILHAAGCRTAFGMPGGEILAFVAALERAGIRFVLTRHETAAGFMGEGVWHATGAPALLVTTLGPGLTNAVNVIANAHQDRVPMIMVSACIDGALAQSYTHQIIDHQAILKPITKATFRVERGAEAATAAKAIRIALSGRPGPVHLDLPMPVAEGVAPRQQTAPVFLPAASVPADLSRARAMIAAAERPLVLAGLDLLSSAGAAALDAFTRAAGAPALTTYKAKGLIDEADPRAVGAVGLSPRADAIVKPLMDAADLVVLAGYDPIEMRAGWRHPWAADKAVVDLVAEDLPHGMHAATLTHVGDVAGMLNALTPDGPGRATWPDAMPADIRSQLRRAFAPPAGKSFGPHAVFETLRGIAPPGTVASADSGAHRILLSQMWSCDGPRTLIQSSGFCTMGGALPLAAGHAFATGRHTLCFVGDAGLEMVLGELATLRDLALPVIVVVLVDRSLALIELKQRAMQLPRQGVDFGGTDFAAVASALGGHGAAAADAASLEREARAAFARPGFTLIAAEIGERAYDGAF